MLSSVYHTKHSTAQRNQPCTRQRSSTYRSDCDNESKQTELARASMSSRASTAYCVLKTNEEIEICPARKHIPVLPYVQAAGYARMILLFFISNLGNDRTLFVILRTYLDLYLYDECTRRPGCFPGVCMEQLAFASRQFAPNSGPLSAPFTLFSALLFPCERAQRPETARGAKRLVFFIQYLTCHGHGRGCLLASDMYLLSDFSGYTSCAAEKVDHPQGRFPIGDKSGCGTYRRKRAISIPIFPIFFDGVPDDLKTI